MKDSRKIQASEVLEEAEARIMETFNLESPIPQNWTGSVQVRGCVTVGSGDDESIEEACEEKAEFYGVYVQTRKGLHEFVADRTTKDDADDLAQRLRMFGRILIHNLTEAEIKKALAEG